jgi:hypothetical protein
MPPKRGTRGRTVALGKASKKTPTPTPADDESSHDEHDDGVMPPKRPTRGRTVGLVKASKKTPTPTPADDEFSHDELDDGAAGGEDAAESDHQSVGSQPKKTKVRSDLNEEEEEAMADWLGDHPELYNKKLNAYKDKVKKDAAWAEQAARLDKPVAFLLVWYRSIRTRYGKLAKMKSGAGAEKTERDAWILRRLHFLRPHIHEVKPRNLVSVSTTCVCNCCVLLICFIFDFDISYYACNIFLT